jgi:hypothetical protein
LIFSLFFGVSVGKIFDIVLKETVIIKCEISHSVDCEEYKFV